MMEDMHIRHQDLDQLYIHNLKAKMEYQNKSVLYEV